ncbi:MAG: futalosine hydrolase [Alphaproteobacteria bacterium]|uniref:Futalosine hydrolase n=1 Tax=Candidatus Nitrobium versatile TaxID=2884831 RepID=A0A953J5J0_9BACT|nr:futalosine hydrolase [Candidatus Nitrobium versatile]
MTGIVVSTEREAGLLLRQLAGGERIFLQQKSFYRGNLKGSVPTVICICGVGKANAAHGTALLLERFGPDLVWSIGVAGAYPSSGLEVGAVAVAEKDIYGDEGLVTGRGGSGFHSMDVLHLPLCTVDSTHYYNAFPLFVPECLQGCGNRGIFVTVSACSGTRERGIELEGRFGALCESMEGAAVAHVCTLNSIPVAEVRAVSNIIEDRSAEPLDRESLITAAGRVQEYFLDVCI